MAEVPAHAAEPVPATRRERADAAVGARVFGLVFGALLALFVASAALFADLSAIRPEGRARFCLFLALVTAYTVAAAVVAARGARRDFAALRGVADTTPERWQRHERRFLDRRGSAVAAAIGLALGLGIERLGASLGEDRSEAWRGLVVWSAILNALLFASIAVLARWTLLEIAALRALGRRVRVSLLDRSALAPFVRAGLRSALLWLLGSSLALTLLADVNEPAVVLSVVAVTLGLGVAALLLPSRGLHERLSAARADELAWVRREIARARAALAASDAASRDEAARLPALLAWEARVADMSAWPFDAPSLMRFALFLLVPLGSWLGAAFVERALDATLAR